MAQHKAPTAVTVAPIAEKSSLEAWVAKYWVHGALVFLVIVAFVVWRHFQEQGETRARDNSWSRIAEQTTPNVYTRLPSGEPAAMAALADELKDTAAGPSARIYQANSYLENDQFDEAVSVLDQLATEHPDFEIVKEEYSFSEEAAAATMAAQLRTAVQRRQQWLASNPGLSANPDAPEGSPEVVVKTDQGDIRIRLYADESPLHVANMLKLAGEGYYDGTKFHRVTGQSGGMAMIQGGDPNSKEGDPSTWGQGGPEEKVDYERNSLRHFRGVLSAAKKGNELESNGSQFFITTGPAHHLDGKHVVYGQVIEGIEIAEKIIESATFQQDAPDRPENPVVIHTVEVVE